MVGTLQRVQQQYLQESAAKDGIGTKVVSTRSCVRVSAKSKNSQQQDQPRAGKNESDKAETCNKQQHITTITSVIHLHKQDNPTATATTIKSSSNSHDRNTRRANSNTATNTATTPPPTKPQ